MWTCDGVLGRVFLLAVVWCFDLVWGWFVCFVWDIFDKVLVVFLFFLVLFLIPYN